MKRRACSKTALAIAFCSCSLSSFSVTFALLPFLLSLLCSCIHMYVYICCSFPCFPVLLSLLCSCIRMYVNISCSFLPTYLPLPLSFIHASCVQLPVSLRDSSSVYPICIHRLVCTHVIGPSCSHNTKAHLRVKMCWPVCFAAAGADDVVALCQVYAPSRLLVRLF